jgi:hypothetical protein
VATAGISSSKDWRVNGTSIKKKEEGRRKREERRKKEEGRRKKEEGRR